MLGLSVIICLSYLLSETEGRTEFIVNGTTAQYEDYPYQGSLQLLGSHVCGCVFLAPNWVLTAGHCVSFPPASLRVMFGSASLANETEGTFAGVANITRHPSYDQGDGFTPNDIALLELEEPIDNELVNPISMALDSAAPPDGANCYISGWGRTCGICPLPIDLQAATTYIMDDIECENATGLDRDGIPNYQPENMICIYTGYNGACNGDSGGPLACENNGVRLLYGVTSWGFLGCPTSAPSVYTRVGTFREWVCGIAGSDLDTGIPDCGNSNVIEEDNII